MAASYRHKIEWNKWDTKYTYYMIPFILIQELVKAMRTGKLLNINMNEETFLTMGNALCPDLSWLCGCWKKIIEISLRYDSFTVCKNIYHICPLAIAGLMSLNFIWESKLKKSIFKVKG